LFKIILLAIIETAILLVRLMDSVYDGDESFLEIIAEEAHMNPLPDEIIRNIRGNKTSVVIVIINESIIIIDNETWLNN
jgi:hypothetical protein